MTRALPIVAALLAGALAGALALATPPAPIAALLAGVVAFIAWALLGVLGDTIDRLEEENRLLRRLPPSRR